MAVSKTFTFSVLLLIDVMFIFLENSCSSSNTNKCQSFPGTLKSVTICLRILTFQEINYLD